MSIDRTALRQLHSVAMSIYDIGNREKMDARAFVMDAVPDLIDELDAKDRRIAELETGGTMKDALVRELDADLLSVRNTCAVQLARSVNLERNFTEAVRRVSEVETKLSIATELNVNDRKRIAELEAQNEALQAGLREALRWHRPLTYKELLEVEGGHETQLVPRDIRIGSERLVDVMARLEKLLPSEEK